jgi:signal transduction histidine kinase/CheY-like chemotaxis protein
LDVQDVQNTILDWVEKLFLAQMVWLAIYNSQSKEIELTEVRGPISEDISNAFSHGGEGITEAVFATKQIIVAPDVTTDERVRYKDAALKAGIKSIVGLPLMIQDKVIGVLGFSSSQFEEQQTIEPTQMNLLTIFANQTAIALENAQLYSDLKRSEQKLQESLRQLQRAQEHLIQIEKLRALGEMASGIAHNFNNILTGILGYASILLESNMDDKEMLISGLKQINKAGENAAAIVKKIQTYAKPQAESFSSVDMNKIVGEVVELTKPRWKDYPQKKGVTVLMEMELGQIHPVIGDEGQLKEVMTNLILNAVDAMPEGGQLTITTFSEGESTIIKVSDSGIGMTEDVRKRIFEPFFTTKTEIGTGLGLSTSYSIIQNHNGEITCESEPKKGATFTIRLPKAPDTKAEQELLPVAENHSPSARILVIDDEASVGEVLQAMLNKCGHQVVCIDNADVGLQTFSDQFDMVMTDLGMPGMNGYELSKRFKKQYSHIPVILITGWNVFPDDERLKESGVDFVLQKPFNMKKLLNVINEAQKKQEEL